MDDNSLCLFDSNCGLGHPTGKTGGFRTAADLLRQMDRLGIRKALVYSYEARHANWQFENSVLMEKIKGIDRLVPCWVVAPEPTWPRQADELAASARKAGVGSFRICPKGQVHRLSAEVCAPVFAAAKKAGLPVILDFEIVGWGEPIDWQGVSEVATSFPDVQMIIPGCILFASRNLYPVFKKHSNLYLDIGAFQEFDGLRNFIKNFGADRAIFGTNFPDRGSEIAMGLVLGRQLDDASRRAIGGGNLAALVDGRRPRRPAPDKDSTFPVVRLPVPAIDTHVHLGFNVAGGAEVTGKMAVESFDAWGVQAGVVSGITLVSGNVVDANQTVLDACKKFPGRLFGWAFFDAAQPKLSKEVCTKMLKHSCFVGFKVHEGVDNRLLDDAGYDGMYDIANKLRIPVLAHANDIRCFDKLLKRTKKRWPNVVILHAHHGGCQDEKGAGRLAALLKNHSNLWHETSTSFAPPDAIRHLVKASGGKRLCYGTDICFMDPDGQIGKILFADITPECRADIFRNNALRLLQRLSCALGGKKLPKT